ncbi:MAG: flippase, partial [Chloroflexota bacterium]
SIWLLLARVLSQMLALAFSLLVARRLGEVVLGQYAFISTVLLIGNLATNLGTDTIIIRHVAAHETSQETSDLLTASLLIQLILSGLLIAGIWLLGGLLPNQTAETLPAFHLIALSLIPVAFSSIFSAVLRGREHMGAFLIFNLATTVTLVVGALVVTSRDGGLMGLALATLTAQTVGALVAAGLFRRLTPCLSWHIRRPSGDLVQTVVRTGFVLALGMVVTLLLGRLGTLSLSLLDSDAATGWFSAAARLVEGLKLIPAAVLGALFPVMARHNAQTDGRSVPTFAPTRLLLIGLVLTIVVAIAIDLLSGPIVMVLYGPGYEPSVTVLRILVWVLPFSVVSLSLSFWLVAAGQERIVLIVMIPALLISAGLMGWAVDRFGLTGAAAGSIGAEFIQMLCLLIAIRIAAST